MTAVAIERSPCGVDPREPPRLPQEVAMDQTGKSAWRSWESVGEPAFPFGVR